MSDSEKKFRFEAGSRFVGDGEGMIPAPRSKGARPCRFTIDGVEVTREEMLHHILAGGGRNRKP